MPGPFPGMDPYLEARAVWPTFHKPFLTQLMYDLNAILPSGYLARQDERVYLATEDGPIRADAAILYSSPSLRRRPIPDSVQATPSVQLSPSMTEVSEPFIEIVTYRDGRRVVSVLQILTPRNKDNASEDRLDYIRRRDEILVRDVHLIEVDLLRGGKHTVALDRERLAAHEPFDYLISLHRARTPLDQFEAWPLTVRDRLPVIRIPLEPGTEDLRFDLQPAFDQAFDGGRFADDMDYGSEPAPRLRSDDREWARERLRAAGFGS
jgi:hypothetical protein